MKNLLKSLFVIAIVFHVTQYDAGYPVIKNVVSEWKADKLSLGHCGALKLTVGKKHIFLKAGNFEWEKVGEEEVSE